MEFARTPRRSRELPLIPLIDIVFILIIFFMLTTSFMKVESMELLLPSAKTARKAGDTSLAHIFLYNDGQLGFGQRPVETDELKRTLTTLFKRNPEQRVVVLAADKVTLQRLVDMMDMVYQLGGKSVYVRAWQPPAETPMPAITVTP